MIGKDNKFLSFINKKKKRELSHIILLLRTLTGFRIYVKGLIV